MLHFITIYKYHCNGSYCGLPWWLSSNESTCQYKGHRFDPWSGKTPGEGNGTCSNILAWEIPWTEESNRLQTLGSQRVRHNLVTKQQQQQLSRSPTISEIYPELSVSRRLSVKNPPAKAGVTRDVGLIPGSGRSPAGGNGNPLQYSCLENPVDRGAWCITVCRIARSWAWLSIWHVTWPELLQSQFP